MRKAFHKRVILTTSIAHEPHQNVLIKLNDDKKKIDDKITSFAILLCFHYRLNQFPSLVIEIV